MIIQGMTSTANGVTALTQLGVIAAQGEEAAKFLQGQLTQDFALLGLSEARLAAFCTPKGRMLASFIGLRRADGEILLVTSRDILAPTLKRLSMFVLRAKAKLRDATAEFDLYGLAGDAVNSIFGATPAQPWTRKDEGNASVVRLYPAGETPRALWIAPAGEAAPSGPALDEALWQWSEVRSGVATITTPIVEALVPQMLNYESVGGVNFKKGCYPGQEVVARSQFRGTLKRRAYIAHLSDAESMAPGQELFHEADASQPCGIVVQAAPSPEGGCDAIVSMQIAAAQGGKVTIGSPGGALVALQPAPYPLLADV
jgi:folate-binding protein YgfZ